MVVVIYKEGADELVKLTVNVGPQRDRPCAYFLERERERGVGEKSILSSILHNKAKL